MEKLYVISVAKAVGQDVRVRLTDKGIYDANRKVQLSSSHLDQLDIPVTAITHIRDILHDVHFVVNEDKTPQRAKKELSKQSSVFADLAAHFKQMLQKHALWNEELSNDIPKHWEKHDDLIIFPINSLNNPIWKQVPQNELWSPITQILKIQRIAKKSVINNDDFRSPKVELLHGENVWATRKENGIFYTWNITKSMFSVGNVTEKQRLAQFNCQGQTIVDLFAGIGYFTLTYLIHAKANHVFACEWNPDAVKALKMNLAKNKMEEKCTVLQGDNRETCPANVADHVNLGLLPTSSISYEVACRALKQDSGGILHIHGNVRSSSSNEKEDWQKWCDETELEIQRILGPKWTTQQIHLEPVKSFAPRVEHLVLDLKCCPIKE